MIKSSMQTSIDWKFIIMFIVAIAGVAIPVWLWYADHASHSLHVKIVSQTALQPNGSNAVSGLKLSIDGRELKTPYLTVIDIRNDGRKPISIPDFEGPLEIKSLEQVNIIRAQLTETNPKDIQPSLSSSDKLLKLQPLLLNPNDSMTIAILTTGGMPKFMVRARIAEISSVELEEISPNNKSKKRAWIIAAIGFALFITYVSTFQCFLSYKKDSFEIPRWYLLFYGLSSGVGSALIAAMLIVDFNIGEWQLLLIGLLGIIISIFSNRSSRRRELDLKKLGSK